MVISLVILRHALAGKRRRWDDDDRGRPLDGTGLAQSLAMAGRLGDVPVDRILTSPYARCEHTVAPLAALRRLPVVAVPWLATGSPVETVVRGIGTLRGQPLLCTHGELIGPLMDALADRFTLPAGYPTELDKAQALHLMFGEDEAVVRTIDVPPLDRARAALAQLGLVIEL